MEQPEDGETFTGKIDRISKAGNAIIEIEGGDKHINLGPLTDDCEGKTVEAVMKNGTFAKCQTDSLTPEDYDERFELLMNPLRSRLEGFRSIVPDIFPNPNPLIEFCDECGSMMIGDGDEWKCRRCGYTTPKDTDEVEGSDESEETAGSSSGPPSDMDSAVSGNTAGSSASQTSAPDHDAYDAPTMPEPLSREIDSDRDLSELRERAVSDAVEEVPAGATTTTHTAPEYTRSNAIREYVLARANGTCEGCGESAPFADKNGNPYLHAHHINELASGGSDTLETVVALCPNCHFRVHHGEDGDVYNEKLREYVRRIETGKTT